MSGDQRMMRPATSQADLTEHNGLADLVRALIEMMQAGNIGRMDLEHGDLRLSLRAGGVSQPAVATPAYPASVASEPSQEAAEPVDDDTYVITAPMIGTFYAAPSPNEPPFVQPGDRVEEGQTIGIIEAMKIMNEIASDRAGTVVDIVAQNAQTVEYGSPLIRITAGG